MPDKHEVGGSSPLGPTSEAKDFTKLNIAQGDLVLSSSKKQPQRGAGSKVKGSGKSKGSESCREI